MIDYCDVWSLTTHRLDALRNLSCPNALLTLTTDISIDSCDVVAHTFPLPIYEDDVLPHSFVQIWLVVVATEERYSVTTIAEKETVRDAKEKFRHIALNSDTVYCG